MGATVEAVINGRCTLTQLWWSDLLRMTVLPLCNRWRPLWSIIKIYFFRKKTPKQSSAGKWLLLGVSSGETRILFLLFPWRRRRRPCRRGCVICPRLLLQEERHSLLLCVFCSGSFEQTVVFACVRMNRTGVSANDSWGSAVSPVSFRPSSLDAFEKQNRHNYAEMEGFFFFLHCAKQTKAERSHWLKRTHLFMMVFA